MTYFGLICRDICHLVDAYLEPPHSPCLAMCQSEAAICNALRIEKDNPDENPISSTVIGWHALPGTLYFPYLSIRGPTVKVWNRPTTERCSSMMWQKFCQTTLIFEITPERQTLSGPMSIRDYFARHYDIHQLAMQSDSEWGNVK